MTHTLTYHSIQKVQLRHHHIGRGIGLYAPTPAWAHAPAHSNATQPHLRYCVADSTRLSKSTFEGSGEDGKEEEGNSVKEEDSYGNEGFPAAVGKSQVTGGPTLAQYNQPVSHKSELSLLAMFQQMTQIMTNVLADSSSESSRPRAFKTPSMKAPECFSGTKPFKVRSFIQSCQLIFNNDPQISLKTERNFFMPLHFSLAGIQNGLSLIISISLIKIQITF
ncbi:hypothetical protein O181_042802 [Austropuccinia psidii MF-1]|uniref:Uncharacterized protein n=1 Tax=Austropuccinia psidii MF-1 TaxID=1389203 RepID=A0A9Q3DNJ1_9BASI|nr:hypothetical protein [Austropuccinia psidii MF-1]